LTLEHCLKVQEWQKIVVDWVNYWAYIVVNIMCMYRLVISFTVLLYFNDLHLYIGRIYIYSSKRCEPPHIFLHTPSSWRRHILQHSCSVVVLVLTPTHFIYRCTTTFACDYIVRKHHYTVKIAWNIRTKIMPGSQCS
jgi:hypothetical protein